MKGMPLFIPYCLRSKAIEPLILPVPVPLPDKVRLSVSGFETPRIVNVPGMSKVVGPVCTTLEERNVMYGLFFASKKSLLFSLPSFRPLPVLTLPASTLMSKTPVVTSGDVNFRVDSHFSKTPAIGTDAFTLKVILKPPAGGVISKTGTSAGACARLAEESERNAMRQKTVSRMLQIL